MTQVSDGMNYAPKGKPKPVVDRGEFIFAATHLDHGHINGMCNGLVEAGGVLKYVHDSQPDRAKALAEQHGAEVVDCIDAILEDNGIHLVAAAAIPNERGPLGCRVMQAGKDYFTDKCPFTTLEQLEDAKKVTVATGRKYMVYYSERLHVESSVYAGQLIADGAVGEVIQVIALAPHRLNKPNRPDWFFQKEQYGGIITDIGSHQFEQFLAYTGADDGSVNFARVDNFANLDKPELEDFGEVSLTMDTGASCYTRIDWFTPDGQQAWGDGRTFILGTEGTMECRKYMDVARQGRDYIFLTNAQEEREFQVTGQIGFPFFGELILDILNRTEHAMTQRHAFKAAELSLLAQKIADGSR